MLNRFTQHGMTIVELMIGIAVFATLLALAAPSLTEFIQNTQIRTSADGVMSGIQLAKTEALRRNTSVRFQLTDSLENGCVLSSAGNSWVVSLDDPTSACDVAPSAVNAPRIVQAKSGSEGAANARVAASGGAGGNNTVIFTGLGRLLATNANSFAVVNITNPTGGVCQHVASTGTMRCLRIQVTTGGDGRMCDPNVTVATDPRFC